MGLQPFPVSGVENINHLLVLSRGSMIYIGREMCHKEMCDPSKLCVCVTDVSY